MESDDEVQVVVNEKSDCDEDVNVQVVWIWFKSCEMML